MALSRTVRLQKSLYPSHIIPLAAREFVEVCTVSLLSEGDSSVVTIDPNDGAPDETVDELLNYILCAALECHLTG